VNSKDKGGWIMFTPLVPWTHEVHQNAVSDMKKSGYTDITIEQSAEEVQDICKLCDINVHKFTRHGRYPQKDNGIGSLLDDPAVKIIVQP
jgi:delta-aminolevulinic acid dehydratase/porphobilinogen synthase